MVQSYFTTKQLAARLRVSTRTIYRYCRQGMPFMQMSARSLRFDALAVDAWLHNK